MAKQYELYAFLEDSAGKHPFHLIISDPIRSETEQDYYCNVHAPLLFATDKHIYGIDKEQACLLALEFTKQMLSGKRLVDKSGHPIEF